MEGQEREKDEERVGLEQDPEEAARAPPKGRIIALSPRLKCPGESRAGS